jgi:multiple antibiotic resistance protein
MAELLSETIMMSWGESLSFIISMLAITNPAGSLAVFLGMTANKSEHDRRQTALAATLAIFIVLVLMTWLGIPILKIFGISLPAFQITGGLIILLRGLAMLHSKETPTSETAEALEVKSYRESIAVVPLAIPIIAGPGAMTNVIIFSRHFPEFLNKLLICLDILVVALIVGAMLFFAGRIGRLIGDTGIKITTRIMGLLLAAIAMSMITNGLMELFPGWS